VIFSVHDSDQTKQEIIAAGAHGFVSKGQDSQDLFRVVRDVLKSSIQAAGWAGMRDGLCHAKLRVLPVEQAMSAAMQGPV
jgi:DNA-binding NarL/FixJ family response regulator